MSTVLRKYIAIVYDAYNCMAGYHEEYIAFTSDSKTKLNDYVEKKYAKRMNDSSYGNKVVYQILTNTPSLNEMFKLHMTDIDRTVADLL